jgi:hypothetical protein
LTDKGTYVEDRGRDGLQIRLATPDDLDEVMRIALAATDENAFLPPNPRKMLNDIWPALNRDHGFMGAIGKPGGMIEGVILLRIGTMWYSDVEIIEEKAIYIHPDYRTARGGRAKRLSDYAKWLSDELHMPLIIGVLSNERTEAKVKLYQRQFGPAAGAFWLYGAKTGDFTVLDGV